MKKYLIALYATAFALIGTTAFSQGIVNVDPLTGAASATIPVSSVSCGQVSVPVSISYQSGVRALDVERTAGMGWQLNAGGQVTRQVRGLPDDVTKDMSNNNRFGWMSSSNTAAAAISSFSIHSAGAACSTEATEFASIGTTFPFNYDTEPDMFYASAPGLSCQMVYNRATSAFVPVVHDDLIIAYTTDPTSHLLTSFTITNDKGIIYVFSSANAVKDAADASGSTPSYFTNQYSQYQYGIQYSSTWYLTSVTDAVGNAVTLAYSGTNTRPSTNPVALYNPNTTIYSAQYIMSETLTRPLLSSISTNNTNAVNQTLSFTWNSTIASGQSIVTSVSGMGRTFGFNYGLSFSSGNVYSRMFLREFVDVGCSTPNDYTFSYGGETAAGGGSYTTLLNDTTSSRPDYWGYPIFSSSPGMQPKVWINPSDTSNQRYAIYNSSTGGGSTPYAYSTTHGSDRSADVTTFNVGDLVGITYGAGGTTTITYEPNSYVDAPSGQVVSGGGVRVKTLTDYDGIDATKNIVHNYTYNDPSTSVTSGKPLTLPMFAFTIPSSGSATGSTLWNTNTVVSDYDLSDEDHTIMYKYSKVSQTGAGSTLYQYYLPATNWDITAAPGCTGCSNEWARTMNITARSNCSASYGPIGNSAYAYPFVHNANYDFEQGMLQKVTAFNDAGTEVSESSYTYHRSYSPSAIAAFKYEDDPNGSLVVRSYNKYNIYYNTGELTATVTKKIYDSPTLTQAQSSTTSYTYATSPHNLMTQQSVTNSDGSTLTTNYRYVKDYTVASSGVANINALYHLQLQNVNAPVETWQEVTRGSTTKTVSANLNLFSNYTPVSVTMYLPSQTLSFVQPDGAPSFSPYAISGSTATKDGQYLVSSNIDTYDRLGAPQTVDDGNKNVKSVVMDHVSSNATATISNAVYNEIAFSDFDTDQASAQACSFTITGSGGFAATGSHTGNAYGLGTGQTMSKTGITHNGKVSNYIFSMWINAATGGTLSFTLTDGTATTFPTKTFTSGAWKYYEWKLPVNTLSSTISISVTTNAAISIDDVLFYPENARVGTASYDPATGYMIAETNTNGVSSYYQKDKWGRLLFQFDQDKNIVKKRSYFTPTQIALPLNTPTLGFDAAVVGVAHTFMAASSSDCVAPVTVTWDFGDGTSTVSGLGDYIQSHTYTSTGTYTVTVTASHPVLGTKTATESVTVSPPPLNVSFCQSGVSVWSSFTNAAGHIVTCLPNPSDAFNSYYTALLVSGGGFGTITYTWQISYDNGSTWSTYGTGTQVTVPCGSSPSPYLMRCAVTSTSGQSTTSGNFQFSVF